MQTIYDFETITDRHLSSSKWHNMDQCSDNSICDAVPLSTADMEFKCAPEIVEKIKEYVSNTILGYSYMNDSFVASYINWMKERHHYTVNSEYLVPTSGVVTSLFAAVKAFTNKNDAVMVMPPVYGPFFFAVERTDRTLVECPLICEESNYKIDFEKMSYLFKTKDVKALIFCSPHNPVGRVWRREELDTLAELCIKHNVFVIADEIHHDIVLSNHDHIVFETINPKLKNRIVTCTSLSKTFNLAGMSLAISIIPDVENKNKFINELAKNPEHTVNGIAYAAYEVAYNKGKTWLRLALQEIANNLNFASDYIRQVIPSVKTYCPEGTYLLWMDFSKLGLAGERLDEFLKTKAKLYLTPGSNFGGSSYSHFARMNVAAPHHVIEAALERLRLAIGALK